MPFESQMQPAFITTYLNAKDVETIAQIAKQHGITFERLASVVLSESAQSESKLARIARLYTFTEAFRYNSRMFDISKAWVMLADRQPNFIYKLDDVARKHSAIVNIENSYFMGSDLSRPLIVVPDKKEGYLPIDGNHRIRKALLVQRAELPAHLLTHREALSIRLDERGKRLFKEYVKRYGKHD